MSKEQNRRDFFKLCTTIGAGLSLCCIGFLRCKKSRTEKPQNTANVPPETVDDDFKELGYCGYACKQKCKVYAATKNNDYAMKVKKAKSLSQKYGKDFKPEDIHCEGCRSERLSYFAVNICTVRECAKKKQLVTCAHCKDFPNCDKDLWTRWPEVKQLIKEMRSRLKS